MQPALAGGSPGKGARCGSKPSGPELVAAGDGAGPQPNPHSPSPSPGSPSTRLQGGLGRCIMQEMRKELWAGSGTARTC